MNLDEFAAAQPPKKTRCRICNCGYVQEINEGRAKGYKYEVMSDWLALKTGENKWYHSIKNHFGFGHDKP